jgi:phosphatidylglycerophosphate synthase
MLKDRQIIYFYLLNKDKMVQNWFGMTDGQQKLVVLGMVAIIVQLIVVIIYDKGHVNWWIVVFYILATAASYVLYYKLALP